MLMANWTDKDLALVEKELNKDLRLPSNREAIKWLEDNGFHWERMINDAKNKRDRSNYGWTYAYGEGEFKYVPSNFAALFDSVHNDWLKSEDYQARVNNR